MNTLGELRIANLALEAGPAENKKKAAKKGKDKPPQVDASIRQPISMNDCPKSPCRISS